MQGKYGMQEQVTESKVLQNPQYHDCYINIKKNSPYFLYRGRLEF